MIPADVASRLRLVVQDQPAAPQPIAPTQRVTDVLSDLVPGQRVMAEIQAMLPNGSYRALVAQREITLALPFSAKAGDTLELEVVETDGKVALAFVANRSGAGAAAALPDSVPATLSQTGKMISDLLGSVSDGGRRAAPAPLNGNQALVENFPASGAELAPILKEALSKSGVFYEAHQARWVAGEMPTERLLQEPQGQHSQLRPSTENLPASLASAASNAQTGDEAIQSQPRNNITEVAPQAPARSTGIPAELAPLVQQQLDALANQSFAWQGQIWPGQQMHWEIDDQQHNSTDPDGEGSARWQTRLKVTLPNLGGLEATLRLRPGNEVEIRLQTDSDASESALSTAATQLKQQFAAAGLNLTQLLVKHDTPAE